MKRILPVVFLMALSCSVVLAQSNVGIGTNDPKSKLDIAGGLSLREGTALILSNGNNDNVALSGNYSFYRITGPTTAFSILGIVPATGADGQVVTLVNTTNQVMTIKNNGSGTAANNIKTLTGNDIVSVAGNGASVTLHYNKTDALWYVTGTENFAVNVSSVPTGDITTGNNAILMTNNTGRLVGTATMTLDVKTNDLNQKGLVPGPSGGNNNQVWGTDNSGFPAWQKVNNSMLTNNSVTVTAGTGLSGGGAVALGGTVTLNNTGDTNPNDDITTSTSAGGDLAGTYPNPTVAKVRGVNVSAAAPTNNQVMKYNSGTSQWEPGTDNVNAGTITQINTTGPITGGPITSTGTIGLTQTGDVLAGAGISVSGGTDVLPGTANITVTNTAPDQTVTLSNGTGISVSGTYPNFTITNTSPSSGGTVTSVGGTAPIVSSGGNTPTISITQSGTSANGYLSSTDWNTFNNKTGGSGTANYLPKWSGTNTLTNSQIFENGTNIGIGTTGAGAKLEVNQASGSHEVAHFIQGVPASYNADVWWMSTGTNNWLISKRTTDGSGDFWMYNPGLGYPSIAMRSGGNVGIGTATPNQKLEVNGNARIDGLAGSTNRLVYANASGDLNTNNNAISKTDPILVRGTGLNNNANGLVIIAGTTVVNTTTRGLTLTIINKSTHAVVSANSYDTYGSTTACDNLAAALNGINNGQIGILVSYDAWEGVSTTNLQNAFKRLGLYKALMTTIGGSRRPYAAIFEASSSSGIPSASATEVEHSADAQQPYAEIRGWLLDGGFVATTQELSGLSTPIGVNAVAVNENGNVGVGTTAPTNKLDVYGYLGVRGNTVLSTGYDRFSGNVTDIYGNIRVLRSESTLGDGMYIGYGGSGGPLRFFSNNGTTEFMTISTNGNVGIGNTSPGSSLYVGSGGVASGPLSGINVALGGNSYVTASDGTRTAFLGADASGYGMVGTLTGHDFVIRSSNTERIRVLAGGNVGVATSSPSYKLHVGGVASGDGIMIGNFNDQLGWNGSGGQPYTALRFAGYRDVVSNFTGAMIAAVRTNLCCSGLSQAVSLSMFVQPNTATVSGDGNMVERLRVDGTGATSTNYYYFSDRRLKSNFNTLNYGLQSVMEMQPLSYTQVMPKKFSAEEKLEGDTVQSFGFVAQDLYKVVPELVNKPADDKTSYWSVDYAKLTPVLVKAIQEQQKEIEELKAQIKELKTK